jgi:hypothetical protein
MPVNVAVDNEHKLFITYFHHQVPIADVYRAADKLASLATGHGTYRGLVIFEPDVDLSDWDVDTVRGLRQHVASLYRALGLQRGESAAVIHVVPEAHHFMRMWNIVSAVNWDMNMAFNLFWAVDPALRFLNVPADVIHQVLPPGASVRR